jgi:hypothetical protein
MVVRLLVPGFICGLWKPLVLVEAERHKGVVVGICGLFVFSMSMWVSWVVLWALRDGDCFYLPKVDFLP